MGLSAFGSFAGFAWPWLLLALPLPLLLHALVPPVRGAGPALRVPWPARAQALTR